jgi:hypothetical protein
MTFYHLGREGDEYFIDEYTRVGFKKNPSSPEDFEVVHRTYEDFALALSFTIHQSWDAQNIAPEFCEETFGDGENNISKHEQGLVKRIEDAFKSLAIINAASSRPRSTLTLRNNGKRIRVPK